MGVNSSDVIVYLSLASNSINDRLSHHICPEGVVDSKMWLVQGNVTQGAIEIIGWMTSFIEQSVIQLQRDRVLSFVYKSVSVHDRMLGSELLRTKLQFW